MTDKRWVLLFIAVALVPCVLVLVIPRPKEPDLSVANVTRANPKLQEASKHAQATLEGFISDLADARPQQRFAICGRFETDSGPEYLWIRDPAYSNGSFTGILDQTPVVLKRSRGDEVTVKRADVFDWLIEENGEQRGGFTLRVFDK